MSQNGSTAKQNIALVAGEKARRYGQIVIIFILITFTIAFVTWYAFFKADPAFLLYIATGLLAILFAGIGAAFSNMGLGRTVGSAANNNAADPAAIAAVMEIVLEKYGIKQTPGPIDDFPDIENPVPDDDPTTLHEDIPAEVPPERTT